MATQIVMDHKGDTQYNFDPKDADALLRAEERFKELMRAGWLTPGARLSELVSGINVRK